MLNWRKILCRHSNILTVTMGGAVRLYISTVVVYEVVSFLHAHSVTNERNGLKRTDFTAVKVKYNSRRYLLFIIRVRTLQIIESC